MRLNFPAVLAALVCAALPSSALYGQYEDGRAYAKKRIPATDAGPVLRHGDGPRECDSLGARDAWVFPSGDTYYMHYDAAGPTGWLCSLATSRDLIHWSKKGPVLELGRPGEPDSASASYGTTFFADGLWRMFYLGTPHATPLPDRIPAFPYLTLEAVSQRPAGPWQKRRDVTPWQLEPNSYDSVTGSPGFIVRSGGEYLQFVSVATRQGNKIFRTLAIASTQNLEGAWKLPPEPTLPLSEQIENSSLYYEPTIQTWFLFTDHVGIDQGYEYTDAIWVYWSKDVKRWNPAEKAIVLDGTNERWSRHVVGLPSVIKAGRRLAVFYDGRVEQEGYDWRANSLHMKRDIGLAWLDLPLSRPKE